VIGVAVFGTLAIVRFATNSMSPFIFVVALLLMIIVGLWPAILQRYNRLRLYRIIYTRSGLPEYRLTDEAKAPSKHAMSLKKAIRKRAFCTPQGLVGHIGGRLMSLDSQLPVWVVDLLQLQPWESLLEIGFGPGVGIELAGRATRGRIAGIDPSETMLAMAQRRNRAAIESGHVDLRLGTIDRLPFDDEAFDAAMVLNNLHLWPDPVRGLRELARTLRPGGRVAVAITRFSDASPDAFERQLRESGFTAIDVRHGTPGTCALARTNERRRA
jgi:SAM-dependent methyltransferase